MRILRFFVPGFAAALALAAPREAHAEPSSFFEAGAGYSIQRIQTQHIDGKATALSFAVGVGSSPLNSFVAGGMFRMSSYFDLGTDIGIALRLASGSFARGDWGVALDAGAGFRGWDSGQAGKWPLQARLIGGAPWGLELSVGGDFWNLSGDGPYASGISVVAGIDLLRLTIMRQGATEQYWENKHPVGGHQRVD